jgi:hypothetical protein
LTKDVVYKIDVPNVMLCLHLRNNFALNFSQGLCDTETNFLLCHAIPQGRSEMLRAFIVFGNSFKGIGLALPISAAAMPTMKRLCCVCERTVGFNRPKLTESETLGLHSSGDGFIAPFKVMLT